MKITRMNAAEFRGMTVQPKRHKYGARKSETGDSALESRRRFELEMLAKQGVISDLQCQVPFPISINGRSVCTYVADFVYTEGFRLVCEDAKGIRTPDYALKAKLFQATYPDYQFAEYRKGEGRVFMRLTPGGQLRKAA